MQHKSTVLRFLKAKNPDELTQLVGALPFKVEIKEIAKDNKGWVIFFTLPDNLNKLSNDLIKSLVGK